MLIMNIMKLRQKALFSLLLFKSPANHQQHHFEYNSTYKIKTALSLTLIEKADKYD